MNSFLSSIRLYSAFLSLPFFTFFSNFNNFYRILFTITIKLHYTTYLIRVHQTNYIHCDAYVSRILFLCGSRSNIYTCHRFCIACFQIHSSPGQTYPSRLHTIYGMTTVCGSPCRSRVFHHTPSFWQPI